MIVKKRNTHSFGSAALRAGEMLFFVLLMMASPFQFVPPVAVSAAGPVPRTPGPHIMPKIPRGAPTVAPAGAHLTYYGGMVISNAKVEDVFWGSGTYGSNAGPGGSMPAFFNAVGSSAYFDWLTEYNTNITASGGQAGTNQAIGHASSLGEITIAPSAANNGSTIDDTNMQAELTAQLNAGHLPAPSLDAQGYVNTIYALFFPSSKTLTQGGTTGGVQWCAYHGTLSYNGKDVPYMVLPAFTAGSGYANGCGSNPTLFNDFTSVSSHELVESVTDAAVGLASTFAPPLAWYDSTNGEIGDICNAQQGSIAGYVVQAQFSNVANNCIITRPVSNDFSISASPTSLSVAQGASGTSTISTAVAAGSAGTVSLAVSGAPANVTATLSPTSVTAGGSSTLTVTVGATAAAGTYTLTVTGTEGSATHSATVSLTVTATVANNFSISASPTSLTVAQGASGTSTISTAVTAGSAGTVSLAVSGAPANVTASLSPTSVTAGGSSTLTVTVGATAVAGSYTLTITGTEGSATHSATVSLTVTGTVSNDFSISASPTSLTVAQGASGTSTISTAVTAGSAGTVSLAVSGAPANVTATLSPTSVTAGGSSTLTVTVGAAAVPGTYTLTVTGTEGSATHSATVSLTVTGTVANDFSISASPTSLTVAQGASGTSTISTAVTAGSAGTVALSASVSPAGPTASLSPASVTAGSSSTLTISVGASVAAGTYTVTVTGTEGTATHSATVTVTVTASGGGSLVNGGFETGTLSGWTAAGTTGISSVAHSGAHSAQVGGTAATNGDSSINQTFTAPSGVTQLSFYYQLHCPDTLTYDWATATLKDNTTGTTVTVLAKTCTNAGSWVQKSTAVTAGHSYTLTLISHDDNYPGDPTYTLYDDVVLSSPPPPGPLVNGGFETGTLSGWTAAGTTGVSSVAHSGAFSARVGGTAATNGDSSINQTFTAPSGVTTLSFYYEIHCPDTLTYDWATATLKNNTTGTTVTVLAKTCTNAGSWVQKSTAVTAGHSYTLTLISHDDNYPGDPTYTLYDDVVLN